MARVNLPKVPTQWVDGNGRPTREMQAYMQALHRLVAKPGSTLEQVRLETSGLTDEAALLAEGINTLSVQLQEVQTLAAELKIAVGAIGLASTEKAGLVKQAVNVGDVVIDTIDDVQPLLLQLVNSMKNAGLMNG